MPSSQKLDPRAVWLFFSRFLILWIPLLLWISFAGITFVNGFNNKGNEIALALLRWSWIIIPGLFIILLLWAKLTFRFYSYELRKDGIRKELGVIWKKDVIIPYERIQNVDIHRGIIARLLNLSDIRIQTAGSSSPYTNPFGIFGNNAEGNLPGLAQGTARQLRDELIHRSRQKNDAIL